MYFLILIFFSFISLTSNNNNDLYGIARDRILINKDPLKEKTDYEWTIVGAGVGGIIALSILLDLGIPAESIYWIDPLFNVGRIGEYYENVTSNTPNKFWVSFLKASETIATITHTYIEYLETLNQNDFNTLAIIAKPLQDVTDTLIKYIPHRIGYIDHLEFFDTVWHVSINNTIKTSRNVILATGCKPIIPNYNNFADIIPLDYAIDPEILKRMVKKNDTIAVFGGSHSAILILKYLSSFDVKYIYNFYKHPLLYAIDMGNYILYNNNGLKGETALWARDVLESNPPKNLERIQNNEENRNHYLPLCNKIIYAIGYEKNTLPPIDGDGLHEISFDPQTGIIGPRLFGIGIAFPGTVVDPLGNKEQAIGLNSFMIYALKFIPEWIKSKKIESRDALLRVLNQLYILENVLHISIL